MKVVSIYWAFGTCPGSVLSPFSVGSYYKADSTGILVFTDKKTKAQSILVICQRPQNKGQNWDLSQVWLLITVLCSPLWGFMELEDPGCLNPSFWSRTVLFSQSRVKDWFACCVFCPACHGVIEFQSTCRVPPHRLITQPTQYPLRPSSDHFSEGAAMSSYYGRLSSEDFSQFPHVSHCRASANS